MALYVASHYKVTAISPRVHSSPDSPLFLRFLHLLLRTGVGQVTLPRDFSVLTLARASGLGGEIASPTSVEIVGLPALQSVEFPYVAPRLGTGQVGSVAHFKGLLRFSPVC